MSAQVAEKGGRRRRWDSSKHDTYVVGGVAPAASTCLRVFVHRVWLPYPSFGLLPLLLQKEQEQ